MPVVSANAMPDEKLIPTGKEIVSPAPAVFPGIMYVCTGVSEPTVGALDLLYNFRYRCAAFRLNTATEYMVPADPFTLVAFVDAAEINSYGVAPPEAIACGAVRKAFVSCG